MSGPRTMRKLLLPSMLVLVACGGDPDLGLPDPACNPLGGARCMTPWPSAVYEVDDPATATGRRLAIPAGTLPTNADGIAIDPARYNRHDGFSSAAPIMTAFETGVDPSNLVPYTDYPASVTPASPTVLIDMSTGELVPHFAELDAQAAEQPASQALFIRPAQLLKGGTRYAVAIKKTLKAAGGGELPVPPGFQAIVDDRATSHALLEQVRPRYPAIFAALDAHGIPKDELVVAWDFTTASRASVRADLVAARAAALAMIGTGEQLTYTITRDNLAPTDPRFARRIDGTFDAPLFLTDGGRTAPTTELVRDASGQPMATGFYKVPFTALVPKCAEQATNPVGIMIYGHGLFGTADLVETAGGRHAAAGTCMVALATDLRGMSTPDVPNIALALNDANGTPRVFDVIIQGLMNHVALVQIARGTLAQKLFVDASDRSYVDPDHIVYYGISQGGIMGTTVCAIDPVLRRCVLQVGAINFSLLLERSSKWPLYRLSLAGAYHDPLDVALVLGLMQQEWDRTEPTGVADVITTTGFPDTPPKQVFMQIGIADDEVSNVASAYQARTMGIPVVTPSPDVPLGVTATAGPATSGMILFDYGLGATIPPTNEAPPDNEVHQYIRSQQATVDMIKRFYETGEIVQLCTAPTGCDCTAGGCGATL